MTEAVEYLDFETFLRIEERSEIRHEYVGGRAYAMSGGAERHDLAAGLLYEMVARGARAAGCRPFAGNRSVRTPSGSAYYPDAMVACGPAPDRQDETDPALTVEVLSPSTMQIDRREKATAYAAIPTLELILLVDPNDRRIEVARPAAGRIGEWQLYGPGELIVTRFGDIHVDTLYDEIDATATT